MKKHPICLNRAFGFIALLSVLFLQSSPVFAQQNAEERREFPPLPPLPPAPVSPIEKAEQNGTALRLSLKDITKMALQNNLEIAIEDTNEGIYQEKILQAHGAYDPILGVSAGYSASKDPNNNYATKSTIGNYSKSNYSYWNLSLQKSVKTGGTFNFEYNANRRDSDIRFYLFVPQYSANTTVGFRQPLRRNFRIDQTRQQIKLANLDLKMNESQFKSRVVDIIAGIQQQYWDLVGAIRNYEIQRDFFRKAQILLRDNQRKVEIGTLPAIDVTSTRTQLAQREGNMIVAERNVYDAESRLLTMICNDRNNAMWSQTIVPTEKAEFEEYKVDIAAATANALKNRPELEQLDFDLQKYNLNEQLIKDNRRWQFDVTGAFGTTAIAGPQSYSPDPFTGLPVMNTDPSMVGGIGNAYKQLFSGGYTNWSLGFDIRIPLRNRSIDAQIAQVNLQKRQEIIRRKNSEQKIQAEIRTAARRLEADRQLVESATAQREFAYQQLMGEQKRFEGGVIENFRVLDSQSNFSQAEYSELQALISYKKSIIDFQKSEYSLLESNDFVTAGSASSKVPALR
jgi:outer membrane protein TolC